MFAIEPIFTNIIFPIITSIIAGFFLWRLYNKPKLYFYINNFGYAVMFPTKEDDSRTISYGQFTCSLTILNKGSTSLKNVQIFHTVDVSCDKKSAKGNTRYVAVGVFPTIPYEFSDDGKILIFGSLVPKDIITISYIYPALYNQQGTEVIHQFSCQGIPIIRSDEAIGEPINFVKSINIPSWIQVLLWLLMFVGFWESTVFIANLTALVKLYSIQILG